tara:strand:- start:2140 stop:2772 length:633 start_codon:yes stop_codon:yes gene_type:complete
MARKAKGKFKMKGHTLPGINQRSETSNMKDGKSPSSAFQQKTTVDASDWDAGDIKSYIDQNMPTSAYDGPKEGWGYATRMILDKLKKRKLKKEQEREDERIRKEDELENMIDETKENQELLDADMPTIEDPLDKYVNENRSELPVMDLPPMPDEEFVDADEVSKPYEVQRGDTLSEIAAANNMTLDELIDKNPEYRDDPDHVLTGATLNL